MRFQGKFKTVSAALTLLVAAGVAQPALAQAVTAATVQVGANIKDQAGADVGTVARVVGENVAIRTDKHEVLVPAASLAKTETGYLVGATREQLNASAEQALAAAQALVVVGATVNDSQGAAVGTITALDPQFATVTLANTEEIKLPIAAVAATATGPVIGMTLADLQAQLSGSATTQQ